MYVCIRVCICVRRTLHSPTPTYPMNVWCVDFIYVVLLCFCGVCVCLCVYVRDRQRLCYRPVASSR